MAERRQATIYLNAEPVKNQIRTLISEKKKLNAEILDMIEGSEDYIRTASRIRELNGILDEHNRKLKPIAQGYNTLTTGGLAKLGALAAGAFSADVILSYGKHLFDLSGQMELLEQRARTVFGEVFPQVTAAAEKNAAAIGLTESQYINAATAIGDFLVPMQFTRQEAADMSTQLVNLSGALAEWEGGQRSATEVSTILAKAMLGEREELKQLGIALSEEDVQNRIRAKGLQGLTGEYAKQAEAIATIEIITESSADAITAFANSSETLARKQAALRAEITNISEKLSATLYPVFERLVGIAGSVVSGLGSMADGFAAFVDPVEAGAIALEEQRSKVQQLETQLPPLLTRYEELSAKSNLSKKEQAELSDVIQQIATITPSAITQIDKYGKVLGISTKAARAFADEQKAILALDNEKQIKRDEARLKATIKAREELQRVVNSGESVRSTGLTTVSRQLSGQEKAKAQAELKDLTTQITALEGRIAKNKGELTKAEKELQDQQKKKGATPSVEDRLKTAAGAPTEKEIKAAEKKRQKEADDLQKHLDDLKKIAAKHNEDYFLQQLDANERELLQLQLQYDKEIAEAKELEAKKVAGATAVREELEKQKYEAINALLAEQYAKEEAARKAEEEKQISAIGEKVATELEARTAFNEQVQEFTLSEQEKEIAELQSHYNLLLTEARKYGIDVTAIEEAFQKKLKEIRAGAAATELTDLEKRKKLLDENAQVYSSYASIAGSALTLLTEANAEHTAAFKVVALAQIALNAAAAIASAVRTAAGEPFPANLVAIAASIAAVTGAIAQARAVFKKAPDVPQRYTGGFFDVRGQDDGRSYNAQYIGSPGTGLLPDRPVLLASERGQEYLISNPDLQNPKVLNYVNAIENIRRARVGGGAVPQFAEGGFAPAGSGGDATAQLAPLVLQMLAVLQSMNGNLEQGIDVRMDDSGVLALASRYRELNKASGGVLG